MQRSLVIGAVALDEDPLDAFQRRLATEIARVGAGQLEHIATDLDRAARRLLDEQDLRPQAVTRGLEVGLLERLAVQAGSSWAGRAPSPRSPGSGLAIAAEVAASI